MCMQAGITHAGQEAADSAQEALQCTVHVAAEAGTADSITSLQQVGPVSLAIPSIYLAAFQQTLSASHLKQPRSSGTWDVR